MLSYLRRFSILVLCTRVFSTTEKISVFKHIGTCGREHISNFGGQSETRYEGICVSGVSDTWLQAGKSCHLFFTITDAACLSVCYDYQS